MAPPATGCPFTLRTLFPFNSSRPLYIKHKRLSIEKESRALLVECQPDNKSRDRTGVSASQGDPSRRSSSAQALTAGGLLGAALLGWLALVSVAPGFGAVVAVFGSPIVACLIILRLLTSTPAREPGPRGRRVSELRDDPEVLRRVLLAQGPVCRDCGATGPLQLRAVLPAGRVPARIESRFVALCAACNQKRGSVARQE
jgi:hypothetical protein